MIDVIYAKTNPSDDVVNSAKEAISTHEWTNSEVIVYKGYLVKNEFSNFESFVIPRYKRGNCVLGDKNGLSLSIGRSSDVLIITDASQDIDKLKDGEVVTIE